VPRKKVENKWENASISSEVKKGSKVSPAKDPLVFFRIQTGAGKGERRLHFQQAEKFRGRGALTCWEGGEEKGKGQPQVSNHGNKEEEGSRQERGPGRARPGKKLRRRSVNTIGIFGRKRAGLSRLVTGVILCLFENPLGEGNGRIANAKAATSRLEGRARGNW